MNRPITFAVAVALFAIAVGSAPVIRSHTLYPEDLVVKYTINDLTGQVSYQEQGALTQGLLCPGAWIDVNQTTTATVQQAHTYQVSVSLRIGRYLIEETQNLLVQRIEKYCAVTPVVTALPTEAECHSRDALIWEPNAAFASGPPLGSGWHDRAGPGQQLATGAKQTVPHAQDLRYNHLRVNFSSLTDGSSIPFTGRLHFQDPVTGNDIYWRDQLGGRCMPTPVTTVSPYGDGYGSPGGCCRYSPTTHQVHVEAANTAFGARPFGSWRIDLQLCNAACV